MKVKKEALMKKLNLCIGLVIETWMRGGVIKLSLLKFLIRFIAFKRN